MAKKHDENKDLTSFRRIGRVDFNNKTLQTSKTAVIGIHLWGKIDYLCKYCGWTFIWNNDVIVTSSSNTENNVNNNKIAKEKLKKLKTVEKEKRNTKRK